MSLLDLLQKQSPLPFDEYMNLALYHPQYGYYATRVDFGVRGDFVTAPTLSSEFTHSLGQFLLSLPTLVGENLIELGPGNGQLAHDLLLFLAAHQLLPKHYYLVETSARLQEMQRALLMRLPPSLFNLIRWVRLDELKDIAGIVLANEFFDALPVVRFTMTEAGIQEVYVKAEAQGLTEFTHSARPEILELGQSLNLPLGYTSEVCLGYRSLAHSLREALACGMVLIIDYGYVAKEYFSSERVQGTLQAYYQHQALNDYLARPGFMDLTAHVNFSYLSYELLAADFNFEFFTYQNVFLLDHGITQNLAERSLEVQQKIKRLLDPGLMGEHFKVLAFSKHAELTYQPTYELSKFL